MDSSQAEAAELPPALPAKQRRSLYSRSSSTSTSSLNLNSRRSSMVLTSPLPSPSSPFAPLFLPNPPSCDCFAPQCPIHHRYEPSDCHHERYFSENTPPPIPKKRLARTMSLPGEFPGSPYTRPALLPQFSNPLYRLSLLEDAVFEPGSGAGEAAAEAHVVPSLRLLHQLDFDTPDEHLPCFFSNLGDRVQVSENLQQHLLLFLRSTAERIEKGVGGVEKPGQLKPHDLLLCRDQIPLQTQDGVLYYSVRCPRLQGQEFSIKVSRQTATPIPAIPQQPHANVQQVISHFPASPEVLSMSEKGGRGLTPEWPQEGSSLIEMQQEGSSDEREHSVLSLLREGCCVSISRDLTQGSLEEFVLEMSSLHSSRPEVYHRRLVLLLLQVTQALQHLKTYGIQVTDLEPHNILLAWAENEGGREMLKRKEPVESQETNDNQRMNNCKSGNEKDTEEQLEKEHGGKLEHRWRRWGTPRVVLTLGPSTTKTSQPITSHHIQLGLLLQHCLNLPEASTSCTTAPPDSSYSQGLLRLLSQLLVPENKLQMADAVPFLQALLWGPRASLFQHSLPNPITVHNWLLVKRSLLLLKLAEKGLFSYQSAVDWEDYLCLQYFCLADPDTVLNATAKLGLHNTELRG